MLPSCAMEGNLRRGELDAVELENGTLTRTAYLCTSRLFELSLATEYVHEVVERLTRQTVKDGGWKGRWIPAELDDTAA